MLTTKLKGNNKNTFQASILCLAITGILMTVCYSSSTPSTAYAQSGDRCRDVLWEGVFNQYQSLNRNNYASKVKHAVCASSEGTQSSSSSGGISMGIPLPIDGGGVLPLKLAGNNENQRFRQIKQSYCSDSSNEISQEDLNWLTRRVASDTIVNAWLACMRRDPTAGLQLELDGVNGNNFFVKVRWAAALEVNQATLEDFYVKGATCDPLLLTRGKIIQTEAISQPCIRNGDEGVSIAINTNRGSATEILPERQVVIDNRILCLKDDEAACERYATEGRVTCGEKPAPPRRWIAPGQPTEEYRRWATCDAKAECWRYRVRSKREYESECRPGSSSALCVAPQNWMDCDNITLRFF